MCGTDQMVILIQVVAYCEAWRERLRFLVRLECSGSWSFKKFLRRVQNTTHVRDCVKSPNTTHGSWWILQVQPTRTAPQPFRYYSLKPLFLAFARKRIKTGVRRSLFVGWT